MSTCSFEIWWIPLIVYAVRSSLHPTFWYRAKNILRRRKILVLLNIQSHFLIDFNKFYTKTFGIVYILFCFWKACWKHRILLAVAFSLVFWFFKDCLYLLFLIVSLFRVSAYFCRLSACLCLYALFYLLLSYLLILLVVYCDFYNMKSVFVPFSEFFHLYTISSSLGVMRIDLFCLQIKQLIN
jgi:hypothetical protein